MAESCGRISFIARESQGNECASKLRTAGRRIMAAVSELAMTQGDSLQLAAKAADLEANLQAATKRLAAGQAPTEDAERELARRIEREAVHPCPATHQVRMYPEQV